MTLLQNSEIFVEKHLYGGSGVPSRNILYNQDFGGLHSVERLSLLSVAQCESMCSDELHNVGEVVDRPARTFTAIRCWKLADCSTFAIGVESQWEILQIVVNFEFMTSNFELNRITPPFYERIRTNRLGDRGADLF